MKFTRSIALILCLIMLLGLMTACQKKMPQTAAGFTQIMENAGFEVYDESDNGEDSIATAAVYAVGENYQIEYYGYEDSVSRAWVSRCASRLSTLPRRSVAPERYSIASESVVFPAST